MKVAPTEGFISHFNSYLKALLKLQCLLVCLRRILQAKLELLPLILRSCEIIQLKSYGSKIAIYNSKYEKLNE